MTSFGIDVQTVFGMPPLEHIRLAANLFCNHISLGLTPVPWNLCGFPTWSLRDDRRLREEVIASLDGNGMTILQGEGFVIRPASDAEGMAADLDLMAALGASQIGTVCMEPDRVRAYDQLSRLAELSAERSLQLNLEFAPPHPIDTLDAALAAIDAIGLPNVKLTIDAMHYFRGGGTVERLMGVPAAKIGYVQLCDVPWHPPHPDYMQEACFERLAPGRGQLPLAALLAVLPAEIPVGLEAPMSCEARAGTLQTAIADAVQRSRALLSQRSQAECMTS